MAFRNNDHIRNKRQADKLFVVIYEEAKKAYKLRKKILDDLYTEIKNIKKLHI